MSCRIEIKGDIPVVVDQNGGCHPVGIMEYDVIKRLESEKAELIEFIKDLFISDFDRERLNRLLNKYREK